MFSRREFLTQTTAAATLVATAAASPSSSAAPAKAPEGGSSRADKAAGTMKSYTIPHTDLEVSRLAYGCAMLGLDWNGSDAVAKTVATIRTAYEQGITLFDTADIYGHGKSELALGEFLKRSPGLRHRVVIQSKCGITEGGGIDNSREHITSSVEGSLGRLGSDRLDILLLHWPDSLVEPQEVAKAFDELHHAGKVRYFGVSNHSASQIELLRRHVRQPLVANQIQLGLAHWYTVAGPSKGAITHGDEGVAGLDYCRVHEIQIQAYSPLKAGNIGKPPNLLNPAADAGAEVKKTAQALEDVANAHGTTASAVMLAWLLHHPASIVPIIGATKPEHVVDNCAADRIELSRAEWYALLRAASQIEPQGVA
jgi:predicted oxidoreductase